MQLCRSGPPGRERPCLLDAAGVRRDASAVAIDWDGAWFAAGGLERLRRLDPLALPVVPDGERWGPAVARPGKIVAIGLNYRDHAAETKARIPSEPVVFMKATTALCGPYDDIRLPEGSQHTDWECELGIVIGAPARRLASPESARGCVAGWVLAHDVSERHWQKDRGGQWDKGKSFDTFCPLGPWLLSLDQLPDPGAIPLYTDVDGQPRQRGSTADMIFDPWTIVHYLSQCMTLEPGDVICTGTPAGVGMGRNPPEFLRAGQTVELSAGPLGRQRSRVVG
jgi:2-keto-4-pentenoate hydratase/2-oxohepta-3-ene-1,7-dioic acid hydratase in catechol pathway